MTVGNIVTWSWYLGTGWERTQFQGLVVSSRLKKNDYEKVRVLVVLAQDGSLLDVRDDEDSLELVA